MATASPPLATRLAEPLSSTNQLLALLIPSLARLDLLQDEPQLLERFSAPAAAEGSDEATKFLKRQLGLVQRVLVERVWPDWEAAVAAEEGVELARVVLERWFVPPSFADPRHAEVALSAYAVLSSLLSPRTTPPLQRRSLELVSSLLARLASAFSLQAVYVAILGRDDTHRTPSAESQDAERWERTVRDLVGLPTRVANAWGAIAERTAIPQGRVGADIPPELEWSTYLANLTRSYAALLWQQSSSPIDEASIPSLAVPLPYLLPSLTFLPTLLPTLATRLLPPTTFPTPAEELIHRRNHAETWRNVIEELPERELARLVRNVLAVVEKDLLRARSKDDSTLPQRVRGAGFLVRELFGPLASEEELWKVVLPVVLEEGGAWDAEEGGMAKVLLSWVGQKVDDRVAFMQVVMEVWGRAEGIKNGGEASRSFLTTLLLLTVNYLPPLHPAAVALSRSPAFLSAISAHLSIIQPATRLLGMLVAELVSATTVPQGGELTPLSFGDEMWAGEEREKQLARSIRALVQAKEDPAAAEGWQQMLRSRWECCEERPSTIATSQKKVQPAAPVQVLVTPAASPRPLISVISDPNDLQPYPLPAPPSASVLSALASDDASLYSTALPSTSASTTRKRGKLRAPVYVPELVSYLKGLDPEGKKEEADGEAERVEVGLREGEALVRRKAGWGGELDENAVDLAFALMSMQDTFDVDEFEQLKLGIMTALVAAVPTKVAPTLVEQYFFNNYSVAQRHSILTALALGARELSGLPLPPQLAIKSGAGKQDVFPSKRLPPALHHRFAEPTPAALPPPEPDALDKLTAELTQTALSSAKEGAEATIPEAAREKLLTVRRFASAKSTTAASSTPAPSYPSLAAEYFILPLINRFWLYLRDTAATSTRGPYSNIGSGGSTSLLSPLILSKYLSTLSLLIHAARHSHHFLLSIVPSTLQLLLALRSTVVEETDPKVLETEMELLLVVLDAVVALDGGESLMGSRSVEGGNELVGMVKEWAEETFEVEEARNKGGAGMGRAGRASAGVLLRIEEILGRWRGKLGWA